MSFENAWTGAEDAIITKLEEVTGYEIENGLFLGKMPNITDAFYFTSGGGDADFQFDGCYASVPLDAEIVGRFSERAHAQEVASGVYRMLSDTSNFSGVSDYVEALRPVIQPEITPEENIIIDGDEVESDHWRLTMELKLYVLR